MKNSGMILSPFNAWVVLQGLETLGIRMQAQSKQALEMAQWLGIAPLCRTCVLPRLAKSPSAHIGDEANERYWRSLVVV